MPEPSILAIDEGTTNAKAILVSPDGRIIAKGSQAVSLEHPHPGWAEQDPEAIWMATLKAIESCLAVTKPGQISALAISNQRESVVMWERETGKPLSPLISWQCRRSEQLCSSFATKDEAKNIQQRTGLVIDPLFPAAKIAWLLNSDERYYSRAQAGELCVGTVDSWILWKLTGGACFMTDYSNASRYLLFNIHTFDWDPVLLQLFGVPRQCLPELVPSSSPRGVTRHVGPLPDGIPILSQVGDSHAALYGQGGFERGVIKATYGTGSSLMTRSDAIPTDDYGVSTTVAWHDGTPTLALEGNITHTGSAIHYISRLLGIEDIDKLSEMAWSEPNNKGVYFVPALSGLGAPHWDAKARGMICGLTDAAGSASLVRAAFESVVFQIADLFYAMQEAGNLSLHALSVDGGPTKNRNLMQLQADLLQIPIISRTEAEVSAIGAAYLAGKALGWWPDHQALAALPREAHTILPNPNNTQVLEDYKQWKAALQRARYQTD